MLSEDTYFSDRKVSVLEWDMKVSTRLLSISTLSTTCIIAYRDSKLLTGKVAMVVVIPAGQFWIREIRLTGPIEDVPTPTEVVLNCEDAIFKS